MGLGVAGFVALGGTRHGLIDDGPPQFGHVLLADVEGFLADCMVWIRARADQLGYRGEATIGVSLVNKQPSRPIVLRSLDEASGELLAPGEGDEREFTTVTARYRPADPNSTDEQVAYRICRDVAHQFGRHEPQLLQPPPDVSAGN